MCHLEALYVKLVHRNLTKVHVQWYFAEVLKLGGVVRKAGSLEHFAFGWICKGTTYGYVGWLVHVQKYFAKVRFRDSKQKTQNSCVEIENSFVELKQRFRMSNGSEIHR